MKLLILSSLLIPCQVMATLPSGQTENVAPTFSNNNNHTIELNTTISLDKPKLSDCTQFQGQRLKECMACQDKESFRQNMRALDDHTALAYWRGLDIKEFVHGLNCYNQEEWREFYQSRKPENKKQFTPSLQTLKRRIKLIYIWAQYHTIFGMWAHDADKTEDLNEFIQKYEFSVKNDITGVIMKIKDKILKHDFEGVKKGSFSEQ